MTNVSTKEKRSVSPCHLVKELFVIFAIPYCRQEAQVVFPIRAMSFVGSVRAVRTAVTDLIQSQSGPCISLAAHVLMDDLEAAGRLSEKCCRNQMPNHGSRRELNVTHLRNGRSTVGAESGRKYV